MSDEATIRRGARNARYTTLPNQVLEDVRLSMEARWLLSYLLSKPDNWIVRVADISKKGGCGRDKARRMVNELVEFGYAEKEQNRGEEGKFGRLSLVVYDEPREAGESNAGSNGEDERPSVAFLPQTENPSTAEPSTVNASLVKTDVLANPDSNLEREARASADGQASEPGDGEAGDSDAPDRADRHGTAAFAKRVMRFCNGTGFAAGPWPNWDTSSPDWIGRKFAALSPAERAEAERWRDAYLLDIAERKKTPVVVGNFFTGRIWTGLDPAVLDRFERRRMAQAKPEERAQPDGWAACRGPVGMAWLFDTMAKGPKDAAAMARPLLTDAQLRDAWPAVWWFQAMDRQKGGAIFDPEWHAMKGLMEFVPKGTAVLAAWREHFAAMGWKWLNAFDQADGVYCPKGGPEGLEAFAAAVRAGEGVGTEQAAQARKAG